METLFNYHHVAKKKTTVVCMFLLCALLAPFLAIGAVDNSKMSLTVAPPLFQISLQPGETWSSGVTVVNNNKYDTTLYAESVMFKPSGESGRPDFIAQNDLLGGVDESVLAGWITIPQHSFVIPREQTYTLPIVINIPEDASPGGHYAAVLVGNRAPAGAPKESTVNVTSSIAVLFFLTVSGEVIEKGRVRDFVTEQSVYETAEAKLSLRFENQGNVHLRPQGDITIYNMFGKKRGYIPVNQNGSYGNVLPGSMRKYVFTWKSDHGSWDIGRYKAEVTLGYGEDSKSSALSTTYFYILPIIPLIEVIGGALLLILFAGWTIRVYVRRALTIEADRVNKTDKLHNMVKNIDEEHTEEQESVVENVPTKLRISTLVRPIQIGIIDLSKTHKKNIVLESRQENIETLSTKEYSISLFLKEYRLFFLFIFIAVFVAFILSVYFYDVTMSSREYDVAELKSDGSRIDFLEK